MHGVAWFGILGPLEVTSGGRPVPVLGRRQRELLAVLLLRANQTVPVDLLIDVAWPDRPPQTARRQVQNCVRRLRRTLAAGGIATDVIETRPGGYVLKAVDDEVDVLSFARHVAEGRHLADASQAEAVSRLRRALSLWRGAPLADLDSHVLAAEARRLHEQRLAVLEECLELELKLGSHHEVAGELIALVREYPLRERLWAQLMLALYRDGRKAEALEAYRNARDGLVAELGLEPGPELRELERAILTGDVTLDLERAPPEQQDERVKPRQLPPDIADFTGRDEVVTHVEGLLREGLEGRALIIAAVTGQAGVGKTTLAVHVAHGLKGDFPDGQLYVNLRGGGQAHRAEPFEVLGRFLRALGVAGLPETLDERAETYRSLLADRRVLVVLDNAVDVPQVRPLLPGSPGCAVLVTSRSRLAGLPGARLVELNVLESAQAVQMLSRIVGEARVATEDRAARALVRQCGHLPLALRIVGARLVLRSSWTLGRMAGRLADEFHRLNELIHGDLEVRASLELSYQGLPERSRRLFNLLGLLDIPDFAAWICAALLDATVAETDGLIDTLLDAQLLETSGRDAVGQVRYRLHDLVRLYARERSATEIPLAEQIVAIERALGGLLALCERAHIAVSGGDFATLHSTAPRWSPAVAEVGEVIDSDPLSWYETERLNIVIGVRQAADTRLDEICWDLPACTYALFLTRGHNDDFEDILGRALAVTRRSGNRRGAAVMLMGLGLLDAYRHRYDHAAVVLEESINTFREIGELRGLPMALGVAAHIDGMVGRYEDAVARHEEALAAHRAVGDRGSEFLLLRSLGQMLVDSGRPERARPYLEQALTAGRDGDRRIHAEVLYWLGQVYLSASEIDRAESTFKEMLGIAEEIRDPRGEAEARFGLGLVRLETGDLGPAAALFQQAIGLNMPLGEPLMDGRVRIALGRLHCRRKEYDRAAAHLMEADRIFAAIQTPVWRGRALNALGDVLSARGDTAGAHDAWRQALVFFTEVGSTSEVEEVAAKLESR